MDQREFEIQPNSDPNPSTTHVYHLALDIGGNFHFFLLFLSGVYFLCDKVLIFIPFSLLVVVMCYSLNWTLLQYSDQFAYHESM